jgi:predicted DNA-binding protein (UPF0251 family)
VPLVLCYLEGLTRDEAAKQLGLPPSTLKSRLEQARERLRDRPDLSAGMSIFLLLNVNDDKLVVTSISGWSK